MAPSIASIPPAPREPSARARETIFRFHGGQTVMLVVGGIFLAIGIALTVPLNWGLPSDVAIAASSRQLHARVISRDLDRSVTINGNHPTEIRFVYTVDGQRYEGRSRTMNTALLRGAQPEASVPIQVSSLNPKWARLPGTTRSLMGWFGLLFLLFPLVGGGIVFTALRAHHREVRAFVEGTPVMAKVVAFGPDYSTRINGRNPFRVRWEFRAGPEQRIYSGSLSSMSMLALEDLGKAEEIVVLYDPVDPSINTAWIA
jgi:hypothetical protein